MADTAVEDADRDKIPNEAWENLQREPDNPTFGNPTGARKDNGWKVELTMNGTAEKTIHFLKDEEP